MTVFLRLAFAALLFWAVSPVALAQDSNAVVVTRTADGFALASPGDAPTGDATSALLTQVGDGAWSLRVLAPGDVPSEVAARPPSTITRALTDAQRADMDRRLADVWARAEDAGTRAAGARLRAAGARTRAENARVLAAAYDSAFAPEAAVRYTVSGVVARDASDALVRLSASEPLASLESASIEGGRTRVEAEFRFDSVDEWASWKASAETEALLATLGSVQTDLRVRRR